MANTRVKVPRTVLIERIQAKIDEATKEHEAEVARFEKERDAFLAALPKAIEEKAAKITAMKPNELLEFFESLRGDSWKETCTITVKVKWPKPVNEDHYQYQRQNRRDYYSYRGFKGYIESLEKAKRVLEASTEETISVSASDFYANYL